MIILDKVFNSFKDAKNEEGIKFSSCNKCKTCIDYTTFKNCDKCDWDYSEWKGI